jgi:hypothetical protein
MSVYEQPLSPFQDDLFLRATRGDHALDEPAPAPASPATRHAPGRRSRPGLTGARPRHGLVARTVAGGVLVAAAVAAGAIGLGVAGERTATHPGAAAVPASTTPLPATRPRPHAPPQRVSHPRPRQHAPAPAHPHPRRAARSAAPVRLAHPQAAPRPVMRRAPTPAAPGRTRATSSFSEEFSP